MYLYANTYLVWLPLAKTSPLVLANLIDVYARVLPTADNCKYMQPFKWVQGTYICHS